MDTSTALVSIKPEGASCPEAAEEVGIYFLQDSEQMFPESPIGMVNTSQRCSGSYIHRSKRKFQIHEFPEDILHKILSHLTFKEIAQTSILSSTWRQTWRSYPDLNFCRETLNLNGYIPHHADDEREFIMRVNNILEHHQCPRLNRFKVSFGLHKGHKDDLDQWIGFAVDSKSKHIVLNLTPHPECLDDVYVFPLHLFQEYNSCFVESIRLALVILRPPTGFCGLNNLKRIMLHRVLVWRDLNCVLSACALLEHIRLSDCVLAGFTLCQQLVHLHDFTIENCYLKSMELHATNLISFQFQQREMPVILDELLLLKEASIEIMSAKDNLDYSFSTLLNAMPNLERLNLSLFMRRETKGWAVSPRDFIHLRYLKMEIHLHGQVECSSGLLRLVSLLEVAPLLEEMELHMCICDAPTTLFKLSKNRSRVQHSHLKTVYMTGFYGCKGQIELARYILENATALHRMTLDPISKMVHSKSVDASMRLKELTGRRNAKSFVARQKFSQILTIL
ncbi:unnamed protein product [Urochloa decumbens]|uniref:F-box domain-containing protein n=1 Tax=Urochloa decumbens TaxID=240449 RepID=A0ABC9BX08_9POAL